MRALHRTLMAVGAASALGAAAALPQPPREPQPPPPPIEAPAAPAPLKPLTRAELAAGVRVYPGKAALPASLLSARFATDSAETQTLDACVRQSDRCEAFLMELDGKAPSEVLFAFRDQLRLFAETPQGWADRGRFVDPCQEPGAVLRFFGMRAPTHAWLTALRKGEAQPTPPIYADIAAGGVRLQHSGERCATAQGG